jgi:hypothetical protein
MALTDTNEIREEILDEWEQLENATYPEDIISEMADGAIPIYYNEIVAEWAEMPADYNDTWQDGFSVSGSTTIYNLMTADLANYYRDTYNQIYREILEEKEEN